MRLVTKLTGLSADVIRVWERRYKAVVPRRSDGGTRLYSELDLRKLVLLKAAVDAGHAISSIAALDEEQLRSLTDSANSAGGSTIGPKANEGYFELIAQYLERVSRFDASGAADLLARSAAVTEASVFVFEVVLPILREVGDRWHAGDLTVAHEHLVSAQIKGFLFTFTRLFRPLPGAPRLIAATPAGHMHEFGALVAAYLGAARGLHVVYLGANVPDQDLMDAVDKSGADVLILSALIDSGAASRRHLSELLKRTIQRAETWLGTQQNFNVKGHPQGLRHFTSFEDLDAALTMLVARP